MSSRIIPELPSANIHKRENVIRSRTKGLKINKCKISFRYISHFNYTFNRVVVRVYHRKSEITFECGGCGRYIGPILLPIYLSICLLHRRSMNPGLLSGPLIMWVINLGREYRIDRVPDVVPGQSPNWDQMR